MRPRGVLSALLLGAALSCPAWAGQEPAEPIAADEPVADPAVAGGEVARKVEARLTVDPLRGTVGDPLTATLEVLLPPGVTLEPRELGDKLGSLTIVGQSWSGPQAAGEGQNWTWRAQLVAFRTGVFEIPPVKVRLHGDAGEGRTAESNALSVEITSVLDPDQPEAELADLKGPASLPADYRALWVASGILALLLAVSGLLWWLHRRYADRLSAVPQEDDPFQRVAPDVWIYSELQKLLARRLEEQGQVDLFFAELSWIVKRYLSARYRVHLMEQTTAEVSASLRQAGAEARAVSAIVQLLSRCDEVKFAGLRPPAEACRGAVEETYAIVDATRARAGSPAPAQGAA